MVESSRHYRGPTCEQYISFPLTCHLIRVQVYTGGLGSYALLVMVAAFLQSHPSQRPLSARSRMAGALEGSLGVLLLDFFRLYGRALHAEHVGVSCRRVQMCHSVAASRRGIRSMVDSLTK